jgi:Bacteriocin-protection, YdeI or OmpD-Associated/Domain of unknown function (DUF1905)
MYTIEKFDGGMHYFLVPESIVKKFEPSKRALCYINGIEFHCAFMKKKEGGYFVNIGNSILKKIKLKKGSDCMATFKADTTSHQFEFPLEFEEVLATDTAAKKIFDALTIGNQRSLLYLVTKVKSVDKKIEKSLLIAEKIKRGITSPQHIVKK